MVAIGQGGSNITPDKALQHVYGYAVGLDMTRRDLQAAMRKGGRPWCIAKGFDASAPIGPIVPAAQAGDAHNAEIHLQVNGQTRQRSEHQPTHLERGRNHCHPEPGMGVAAWRFDLHRHARRRRPRAARRPVGSAHQRLACFARAHRVMLQAPFTPEHQPPRMPCAFAATAATRCNTRSCPTTASPRRVPRLRHHPLHQPLAGGGHHTHLAGPSIAVQAQYRTRKGLWTPRRV